MSPRLRASFVVVALAACGDDRAPPRPPPAPTVEAAAAPAPQASRGEGTIRGVVRLAGPAPAPAEVERSAQGGAFCAKVALRDESVVVGSGGGLANAAVYLTRAPAAAPAPEAPVVLDQTSCQYHPRLQVARVGQTLEIRNTDPTLHNVHAWRDRETVYNLAQVAAAPAVRRPLDEPGLLTFECDVHPWMRAWILVLPHGLAAVTGETGAFTLEHVPAGDYTLEVWHERLGKHSRPVTVTRDGVTDAPFELPP